MSELDRESLRRKRCARVAAIQGIYNFTLTGSIASSTTLFNNLMSQWQQSAHEQDEEWPVDDMPEGALLKKILSGVIDHGEQINAALKSVIKENWKPERMDPVMIASLRCAIYELMHHPDMRTPTLVDEYVTITKDFTDDNELAFFNSALQTLVTQLRP